MKNTTKYVGLDVSKEKIAVAIADDGREQARYWGVIPHTPDAVRRLIKKLSAPDVTLEVCYEAGPTGYDLHRWVVAMGVACTVVAPSLIPTRAGDRIKTDSRDAVRLAQLLRAGELTAIYVPDEECEALRDLIRAREDVREDLHRSRQRLIKFLLRHHVHQPETIKRRWTKAYRDWLGKLSFEKAAEQMTLQEYRQAIFECEERLKRMEQVIAEQAMQGTAAPVIRAIQGLRGIALLTAVTLVTEVGNFSRFRSPRPLMSYLGMVPREYSSGASTRKGSMTKTGNSRVRRTFIEAAWSYRHKPVVKGELEKRLRGLAATVQATSWKAQTRLHKKYRNLVMRGKHTNIAVAAVGRELIGFVWAIACEAESQMRVA